MCRSLGAMRSVRNLPLHFYGIATVFLRYWHDIDMTWERQKACYAQHAILH